MIRIRARSDATSTGRGACGSTDAQIVQARMSRNKAFRGILFITIMSVKAWRGETGDSPHRSEYPNYFVSPRLGSLYRNLPNCDLSNHCIARYKGRSKVRFVPLDIVV